MSKSKKDRYVIDDPVLIPENEYNSESYSSETSESDEEKYNEHRLKLTSKLHKNSCKCQEKYIKIKKRSSKQVIVSEKSCWETDELTTRRRKLEVQLSNSQLEESLNMDRHNILQMRFERVENILEGLVQYLDCLNLETRASYRLCQQLNGLIINEKSIIMTTEVSQLVKKLCEGVRLQENYPCRKNITSALETTKDFSKLILDYHEQKRDYHTASQNFKLLLQNANLNLGQLEKLQRQFDGILLTYQHSRCMLDQELPELISSRLDILMNSFNELGSDLEKTASDRSDLSSLLKHMESSLRTSNDLVAIKGNLHEVPLVGVGGAIMCSNCSRSPAIAGD